MKKTERSAPTWTTSVNRRSIPLRGRSLSLGEARQPGGKLVHVCAVKGDWDATSLKSNMFEWNGRRDPGEGNRFSSSTAQNGSICLRPGKRV
jgi:predicted NUDIX family NTP pyrophosphohydrolase